MKTWTLAGFAAHVAGIAAGMHNADHAALEYAALIVEDEAKRVIGTYDYGWPSLADSTLANKTADTPLLETGKMRASIHHKSSPKVAYVGSNNDKAVWQELGTSRIPPRSFLAEAARHKTDEIVSVIGDVVFTALTVGDAKLLRDYAAFERWAERVLHHLVHRIKEDIKDMFEHDDDDDKKNARSRR